MRFLLLAAILCCGAFGTAVAKEPADDKADKQVLDEAVAKARTTRLAQLEQLLSSRKPGVKQTPAMRKETAAANKELRILKSKKPLPTAWLQATLRIPITEPRVGQVGYLAWDGLDKEARKQKLIAVRALDAASMLVESQWEFRHVAAASTWGVGQSRPTVDFGSTVEKGPRLLLVNVATGNVKAGAEVKTADLFVVVASKNVEGEPCFVLRRLVLEKEK